LTSLTTLLAIMKYYLSRPKSAAVSDIDIDIADILGQKYRYRIDIGNGDIDPPLVFSETTVYMFNTLECTGNSATSNDMKLVHWPLMGGLLHFGTARRGLGGAAARPGPSSLYQM